MLLQDIWKQCCPHIKFVSKKDDVCSTCEILRKDISSATVEEEKMKHSTNLVVHVEQAREEREFYLAGIAESKAEFAGTSQC